MGVAVVMKAVIVNACLFGNTPPELLDAQQRFVGRVAGKQVLFLLADALLMGLEGAVRAYLKVLSEAGE